MLIIVQNNYYNTLVAGARVQMPRNNLFVKFTITRIRVRNKKEINMIFYKIKI